MILLALCRCCTLNRCVLPHDPRRIRSRPRSTRLPPDLSPGHVGFGAHYFSLSHDCPLPGTWFSGLCVLWFVVSISCVCCGLSYPFRWHFCCLVVLLLPSHVRICLFALLCPPPSVHSRNSDPGSHTYHSRHFFPPPAIHLLMSVLLCIEEFHHFLPVPTLFELIWVVPRAKR